MGDDFLDIKRNEIAEYDRKIMELMRKRLDAATAIGTYKKEHGLEVRNHAVEVKVVERYRKLGEEFGLNPDRCELICRIIIQESLNAEDEC